MRPTSTSTAFKLDWVSRSSAWRPSEGLTTGCPCTGACSHPREQDGAQRSLKIEPIERFVGDDEAYSYIGIRADEQNRKGYISTKDNIQPVFPFIEEAITREDVIRILEDFGIGLPKYYQWRSRSGCFFCFYQRKIEWVRLADNHPQRFWEAVEYEEENGGAGYTWAHGESLRDILARREEIEADHEQAQRRAAKRQRARGHPKPTSSGSPSLRWMATMRSRDARCAIGESRREVATGDESAHLS